MVFGGLLVSRDRVHGLNPHSTWDQGRLVELLDLHGDGRSMGDQGGDFMLLAAAPDRRGRSFSLNRDDVLFLEFHGFLVVRRLAGAGRFHGEPTSP